MNKVFFLNSDLANYGEEEFNYLQKFLLEEGVLHTQGANWNDFIDLEVSQHGAGAMSVDVAVGNCVIETVRNSVTFKVFVFNTAIENLIVTANTSGTDRIDAVVMKLSRTTEPNALMNNVAILALVAGDGITALSDGDIQTALGADYDFIRLADITVSNNETAILDVDIADTRARVLTTDAIQYAPTVLKFRVVTADPTTPVEGEMWYNSTDNVMRYYDGSGVINMEASTFTGGNGISLANGIFAVSLATDSGLEFSSAKLKVKGVQKILVSGEVIAGGTLPVPVYQDTTDGELYACDANVLTKLNFLGFAISNSTDGNPITLQTEGIVGGFTGLSEGVEYYVQDAVGTIGTAKGTYTIKVGIAISETEILIIKKERKLIEIGVATGTALDYVNDTSTVITHSLGVIPKIIKIIATRTGLSNNNKASISIGIAKVANDGTVNLQSVSMINAEESDVLNTSAQSTGIAAIGGATAAKQYGSLGTVTSTQMTITFGGTGYGTISPSGTIKYQWEVYAE